MEASRVAGAPMLCGGGEVDRALIGRPRKWRPHFSATATTQPDGAGTGAAPEPTRARACKSAVPPASRALRATRPRFGAAAVPRQPVRRALGALSSAAGAHRARRDRSERGGATSHVAHVKRARRPAGTDSPNSSRILRPRLTRVVLRRGFFRGRFPRLARRPARMASPPAGARAARARRTHVQFARSRRRLPRLARRAARTGTDEALRQLRRPGIRSAEVISLKKTHYQLERKVPLMAELFDEEGLFDFDDEGVLEKLENAFGDERLSAPPPAPCAPPGRD